MRLHDRATVLGVLVVALGACSPEEPAGADPYGQHRSAAKSRGNATCDDMFCDTNGPIVGGLRFWELDNDGGTNDAGIRLVKVQKGLHEYRLSFTGSYWNFQSYGAWPVAKRTDGGASLEGLALVGTTLTLATPDGEVPVTIDAFREIAYYGDAGVLPPPLSYHPIAGFYLTYPVPGVDGGRTTSRSLCPYATIDEEGVEGTWAIFSKGDRFDKATTTISATGGDVRGWFNVSCAGDTIAKLLRIRHAAAGPNFSLRNQRQAALNMFTAKYCSGSPRLYTKFGVELKFSDLFGWAPPLEAFSRPEAIWDQNGALCLTQPRHVPLDEVDCVLPTCNDDQLMKWKDEGGLILSALPPLRRTTKP